MRDVSYANIVESFTVHYFTADLDTACFAAGGVVLTFRGVHTVVHFGISNIVSFNFLNSSSEKNVA